MRGDEKQAKERRRESHAEAAKHLHREISEHIAPGVEVRVEKVVQGPREFEADVLVAPAANPGPGMSYLFVDIKGELPPWLNRAALRVHMQLTELEDH